MIGVYFSGTGNTKYCVEQFLIQYGEKGKAYSIEDPKCIEAVSKTREIVFGYPIYYSSLPKIVHDFLEQNKRQFAGKRIFLLATMGLFSGDGTGCAARMLKRYGATITGGIHLRMPDCIGDVKALKKSKEDNRRLIRQSQQKISESVHKLKAGEPVREGLGVASHIAGLLGQRLWLSKKTKEYVDLVRVDKEKCKGCGLCACRCPMDNLRLEQGKAVPQGRCTMCYRCVSYCPQKAITILGGHVYEQVRIEKYLESESE